MAGISLAVLVGDQDLHVSKGGDVVGDRIVELEMPFFPELHCRDRYDWLAHGVDPHDVVDPGGDARDCIAVSVGLQVCDSTLAKYTDGHPGDFLPLDLAIDQCFSAGDRHRIDLQLGQRRRLEFRGENRLRCDKKGEEPEQAEHGGTSGSRG